MKTDFDVAPVYLKEVRRIQALLCVYFLALLVEALLERELRQAMEREEIESLPLYPEGRPCRWPTARRVIDLFETSSVTRSTATTQAPTVFVTELSDLQRRSSSCSASRHRLPRLTCGRTTNSEKMETRCSERRSQGSAATDSRPRDFRELLVFCWDCGCRPFEAKGLEGGMSISTGGGASSLPEEAKGKKRVRVFYLATERAAQDHQAEDAGR